MTKSIGMITFLHNENYGSTLQAYALQRTVQSLGWDAEMLDYRPDRKEKIINLLRSGNSPRLILEGLRKRAVKAEQSGARSKAASFDRFYQEHMRLSPPLRSGHDLHRQAAKYDALLCGSDQIWSPVWLNPAYFLDFSLDGQPLAAYAPSLGVAHAPVGKKARMMAQLIKRIDALSAREEEGAAVIHSLTGRDVPVLADPVCLLPREEWLKLAKLPHRKHPFLLCYFIGDDPSYWTRVKNYADRTGLRVKVIPVTDEAYHQPYSLADGLSPEEWLGYLAEAAWVCTDSFHGAVFSSILQRPFSVFRRYRDDDPESKNSRIDQLMRQLALDKDADDIPWEDVSARLGRMREEGRDWLCQTLMQAAPTMPSAEAMTASKARL